MINRNIVFLWTSGFILIFCICSFGQTIEVRGTVSDKKNGTPIVFATVSSNKNKSSTTTDYDGKFSLQVLLNDTLVLSAAGMKTQKIKVDKEQITIQLEEIELKVVVEPPIINQNRGLTAADQITEEDIANAENAKYHFKKYSKKDIYIIFISDVISSQFNQDDIAFQQKYNLQYSTIGSYKMDFLVEHNKLTFKHLKRKYKKTWIKEIRKDAIGLQEEYK